MFFQPPFTKTSSQTLNGSSSWHQTILPALLFSTLLIPLLPLRLLAEDVPAIGPIALPQEVRDLEESFNWNELPEADTSPCSVYYADTIYNVAKEVQDACLERFAGKWSDYYIITGHAMICLVLPEYAPAVLHEIKEEGKKDLTYCVFSGLVNASPMDENRKTIYKKNLNRFLEAKDTFGDVTSKMEFETFIRENPIPKLNVNGWDKFKESWLKSRQYLAKNSPEINNPSLYPIWNVYGINGTLGEFTDSTPFWFRTTEGKFEKALASAKTKEQACNYDGAASDLIQALDHGRQLMLNIRSSYRQAKKNIMCQEREKKRLIQINGNDLPPSLTQTFDDAVQGYRQKMAQITEDDKAHVQVLRGIIANLKTVMLKKPQFEQDKQTVQKSLKEAESKMEQCDFDGASALLQSLRENGPQFCNEPVLIGYQDETTQKIKDERDRTSRELKRINDEYNSSLNGPDRDCGKIEDAVNQIDAYSTGNICIKAAADEKLAALKSLLSGNDAALKDLQGRLVIATSNLQNCDINGATTAIAACEEAFSRIKCSSKGDRSRADITELKTKTESIRAARTKLHEETQRILEHAERAGDNCDKVRLQADSEELAKASQEFGGLCKAPVPEVAAALGRIRELLLKKATPEERAREAAIVKEGQTAIKACDVLGANAVADRLSSLGKTCSMDGKEEANKIRQGADAVSKEQDALLQNVSATLKKAQSAWPVSCDYAGLRVAQGEMNRLVEHYATRCPKLPEGISNDVDALEILVEDTKKQQQAAKDLDTWIAAGTANLGRCDAIGATINIESAQDALKRMPCPPRGARGQADIQGLINKRDRIKSANDKLFGMAESLLQSSEKAATVCDKAQLKTDSDQLSAEIKRYTATCSTVPEKAQSVLTRINELFNLKPTPEQLAKEASAIKEGHDALKSCDVIGANAAADQLEFIGKTCSIDGTAEAAKIRSAAGEIAKSQEALLQNVSALRAKADAAWPGTCDYFGLRNAFSELNRVVEPYSTKCPVYPPGVPADIQAVQKMVDDAQKQEQGEKEKRALFDKIQVAWLDCKLLDVQTMMEQMKKLEADMGLNGNCKSIVQQTGQFQMLSDNMAILLDSIETADQLLQACSPYPAVDAELRKAEPLILPIESTIKNCNLAEPKAAIAEMRKSAKQIEETRKNVLNKLSEAETQFRAMDVIGAKAAVEAAEKLYDEAEPKQCFEDLETSMEAAKHIKDIEDDTQDVDEDDDTLVVEELPEDLGEPAVATTVTTYGTTSTTYTSSNNTTSIVTTSITPTTLLPGSGTTFILKETEAPAGPPPNGWTWSNGSASFLVYNGDKFQMTWSPPPAQIDSSGVTITVSCTASPIPNGRAYGVIGVSAIGFETDTPSDKMTAYCNGENGNAGSGQATVTFKPSSGSYEPQITIGFMWGPKYVYKYKNQSGSQ